MAQEKTIVTYSLKASELQEDSDIHSCLQYRYPTTTTQNYKLSKYNLLSRQKFAPDDFEQAVESGKIEYLKKCEEIFTCTRFLIYILFHTVYTLRHLII